MSDTLTNLFLRNDQALRHKRNIWSFYGYSVALAQIPEQDFSIDLFEAIASSSDTADIFLVAVDGSEKFASALSQLHAIDGLFLISEVENWKALASPSEVIHHELFSNPGELKGVTELRL